MTPPVRRVLVIGAGAIGTSWAAHLLHHGLTVVIVDPNPDVHAAAGEHVARLLAEIGDGASASGTPEFRTTITEVADGVDLVIEAGPERLDIKRAIFRELDDLCKPDTLLTTSSSGLLISDVADGLRHPERVLVAHPFNPPHLVPLVELVGGAATSTESLDAAEEFFTGIGKRTIRVNTEVPGHVVNRLQAALWREAYSLVDRGVVSVADIDTAIAWGPGLRWSLLGPFATQHVSGGGHGIRHVLEHLGPPMVEWWNDLGSPELTDTLIDTICAGVDAELDGADDAIRARRDLALRELLALKQSADLP